MINKKRGISELLSYVLLVSLAISLSVIIYPWLRNLVLSNLQSSVCPDGVSIIVEKAVCESAGYLNLTLRNKGLFNINGYILRINNETDIFGNPEGIPFILVESVQLANVLGPANVTSKAWEYRNSHGSVTEFEVEPFRLEEKGKRILCHNAVLRQKISCV